MHLHWNERTSNSALRFRYKWIWQGIVSLVAVVLMTTFAFASTFTTCGALIPKMPGRAPDPC
jgi:hypothetical protein